MAFKNFISLKAPMSDAAMIFGDMNGVIDDPVEWFDPANETLAHLDPANETLAHLMVGIAFPSLTQARKNGWDKPIPPGYSEHKVGKHTRIWVWNPVD